MFGLFFTDNETPKNFTEVCQCDGEKFAQFFHAMLARGIYLAPSAYEASFMSSEHSQQDLDHTLAMAEQVFQMMAS